MKTIKFIAMAIISLTICVSSFASNKSDWEVVTTVDIPEDTEILSRKSTRSENIIYYIDVQGINVTVYTGHVEKFKNKEIVLELVEWYNPVTDKYRYTIRKKADLKKSESNKINMNNLFK